MFMGVLSKIWKSRFPNLVILAIRFHYYLAIYLIHIYCPILAKSKDCNSISFSFSSVFNLYVRKMDPTF